MFAAGLVLGLLIPRSADEPELTPLPIDLPSGRYVSLGDSYSAGEGLAPFEEATRDTDQGGDRCHRSEQFAYARRLTFVNDTIKAYRACSGAVIANVFEVPQEHSGVPNSLGLQVVEQMRGGEVSLVTLTMGGNDLDFAKALRFCFEEKNCSEQPYKGFDSLRAWVTSRLDELGSALTTLYQELRDAFPRARIVVLGYPALFPERAPPWNRLHTSVCNVFFGRWTVGEREAIRDFGIKLNQTIGTAAAESQAQIEFVDIWPFFVGHEPCSTSEWVRFVGLSPDRSIRDGSFHPLRQGQAMMARILSCHLYLIDSAETLPTKSSAYALTGCVAQQATLVFPTPQVPEATS
jgi:hypothetical protein